MASALQEFRSRENLVEENAIMGLSIAAFLIIFLLALIFWIVALVILIKHAPLMPTWAIIVAIICLFLPGPGPFGTILLALLVRK